MSFSDKFAHFFKKVLPSPFTIAIVLTLIVLSIGLLMPNNIPDGKIESAHLNETGDSLILKADGADSYKWSNGSKGSEIRIPFSGEDIHLTVEMGNSGDGYVSSAAVSYTSESGKTAIEEPESQSKFLQLLKAWEGGMWNNNLLAFLVQMMLMLVLGHVLALSQPVDNLIRRLTQFCTDNGRAVVLVSTLTIAVSLFNWGLGLIFGAIFARKVAEHAASKLIKINYPLIGAAGYSGLMVWHGGISGSAPIKISEDGAMGTLMAGKMSSAEIAALPDSIGFGETVFSTMNLTVSAMLLVCIPLFLFFLARKTSESVPNIVPQTEDHNEDKKLVGAEKLDHSMILSIGLGILIVLYAIFNAVEAQNDGLSFKFINPNYINLLLLGLCFILHKNFSRFLKSVEKAIGGTTGILLQFPLYFGILGLMKGSGLMTEISEFFIANSNEVTYPIYTFFSAGIVNIFVPSGGGQWAVQGPIVIESANALGVPLNKSIMALAYGDQLTNMLQPFWALPLLGITGLKAKQILPYTLMIMLVGIAIFLTGLMLF